MTSSFTARLVASLASITLAFVLLDGVARLADPGAAVAIARGAASVAG